MRQKLADWFTGLAGAVVEGWGELRTHRTRVLLSLIGVAIAVGALTSVVAVGAVAQQSITESEERGSGRPAMLSAYVFNPATGQNPSESEFTPMWVNEMQRYGIDYWSRDQYAPVTAKLPTGSVQLSAIAVDPDYQQMFRVELSQGRWFAPDEADRLAPRVVINSPLWNELGKPSLDSHPTIPLIGARTVTAVIVGVYPMQDYGPGSEQLYMLEDAYNQLMPTSDPSMQSFPQYYAWVPVDQADALSARIQSDLQRALGDGYQVQVNRQDYASYETSDPLLPFKILLGGAAGLLLLLGALGLLTISLVTVRYRIQEIGIKRSFGATAGRVFFSVMMESVVATAVAGIAGIILSIIALKNPWVTDLISQGVQDVPGYPVSAAVFGLVISIVVGALAGLLPALYAVRIKPIDAIRY